MGKLSILILSLAVVFCFLRVSFGAEHPGEHPGEAVSAENVRKAIRSYIENDSELKGGYFLFYDGKDKQVLKLEFVRVHDRIGHIKKEDAHFACADFKVVGRRTTYDIDFWMKEDDDGHFKVHKILVHKRNGRPRFTYRDDKIVPVEEPTH